MLTWLLLGAAAAAAQPKIDCKNAEANSDLVHCTMLDYRAADAAMNKAYEAANAVMVASDVDRNKEFDKRVGYREALLASQRAWLKFRGAECVSEGFSSRGGSMESLLVAACLQEVTEARTKQLEALVELY